MTDEKNSPADKIVGSDAGLGRDFVNDWPKKWPEKTLIYREGYQAGFYANGKKIYVPYVDSKKECFIAGFYPGAWDAACA